MRRRTHDLQPRLPRSALAAAAAVLSLLAAAACGRPAGSSAEGLDQGLARREPARVIAAPVLRREVVRRLETTSVVASEREIEVHPHASGVVARVLAEEGDLVAAGDPLCVLDDREEELAVRDAEVALEEARRALKVPELAAAEARARIAAAERRSEQAERDYQRDLRLSEGEVASPVSAQALEASRLARDTALSELEEARIAERRAALEARAAEIAVSRAEVALAQSQLALERRTVRAAFDGVVAERRVRLGQSVGTADAVYVLSDVERLRAVFHRPQEELALFAGAGGGNGSGRELAFTATSDALPGRELTGRILRTSPTIDPTSGQFRVTAVFDDPAAPGEAGLLPGMLVRLRIATDRRPDALVVPKRAVRREGDESHVLAIEDGRVRRVPVREGWPDGDLVQVDPLGGAALEAGDLVVAVGSRDLEDGDPVATAPETDRPGAAERGG